METLQERFQKSMERIGLVSLPCSLPDSAKYCIRFVVGGQEDIFLGDHRKPNGAYIENAVNRALSIYARLPAAPDILRIDDCTGLNIPGLPAPGQLVGDTGYWSLSREPVFLRKLFREIIKSEIDPTGMDFLTGNVYFLNSWDHLLFHLCDDREAYGAAGSEEVLAPLYGSCKAWIAESI